MTIDCEIVQNVIECEIVVSGSQTFLGLSDTPNTYVGQALKMLRINAAENAVEMTASSGTTDSAAIHIDVASEFDGAAAKATPVDADRILIEDSEALFAKKYITFGDISGGDLTSYFNKSVDDLDDITDGTTYKKFSTTEQTKLSGIAAGAEVNVNADWNAVSGDAQILNKPTITTPPTTEEIQDIVGGMVASNTETGISVTYDDVNGKLDFSVTASGAGDVTGPASATDNAVTRFDGITGKAIQNSLVTIDDNGSVNIPTGQAYKINGTALAYGDVGAAAALGVNDNYVTDAEKIVIGNTSNTNSGDNATNSQYSGLVSNATHTGDATGSGALTVVAINGTNLAGLASGVIKNTTTTGVPVISKVAITEPANASTLTIVDGATLTASATASVSGTNTGDNAVNSNYSGLAASTLALDQTSSQTIINGQPIQNTLTASEIVSTDANKKLQSLAVATYPSLTELSYVKGLSSAIQTQIGGKAPIASPTFTGTLTVPTGLTGVLRADTGVVSVDTDVTDIVSAASDSAAGKVELAIASEVTTGTDAARAVTPDGLAGSTIFGTKAIGIICFDYTTNTAVGDGKGYICIPPSLNGMNLVGVSACVITAGTTNTTDIQIANVTDSVDMLSTKMTIDSTELSTATAATAAVIDTTKDDVATGDLLRIDVDAISTTAAKGLIVTLEFRLP